MSMKMDDNENNLILNKDVDNENKVAKHKMRIIWFNAIPILFNHLFAIYAFINIVRGNSIWITLYFYIFSILGSVGVHCGAHRLWAHRSFKANLPLRIILMLLHSLAFQIPLLEWCRDHRVHHKYSDTDADPHNPTRGFFFAHIGWFLVRKHPEVKAKGEGIDLSDLYADPVVMFNRKFHFPLEFLIYFLIPVGSAMYLFNISLFHAAFENCLRHVITSNQTWTINSFGHYFGIKPYDKSMHPRNGFISIYFGMGEGYHNYHHVFPYDYSESEFGWKSNWNPPAAFIDFFHWIGWATDLKKAPEVSIKSRSERTGDPMITIKENKFLSIPWIIDFLIGLSFSTFHIIFAMIFRLIYICVF